LGDIDNSQELGKLHLLHNAYFTASMLNMDLHHCQEENIKKQTQNECQKSSETYIW